MDLRVRKDPVRKWLEWRSTIQFTLTRMLAASIKATNFGCIRRLTVSELVGGQSCCGSFPFNVIPLLAMKGYVEISVDTSVIDDTNGRGDTIDE
uniref:Transmembrane protein n=1 Tax=Loa loa TaxID=7209 RepID=A0A1I7VFP8_LOALO